MRRHVLTSGDDTFHDQLAADLDDLVLGRSGDDLILSDFGRDTIRGGAGDDQILASRPGAFFGGGGADMLQLSLLDEGALQGKTVLVGGAGQDTLSLVLADAEFGYGSLVLGPNGDGWNLSLDGLEPAMSLQVETVFLDVSGLQVGTVQFIGGEGDDGMTAGAGNIIFFGGDGDDILLIRDADGELMLDGGEGDDRLELVNTAGQRAFILLDASSGSFSLGGATGSVFGFETFVLQATAFSDGLILGDGDDVITQDGLGGGNDHYDLGGGADVAVGGMGNDTIIGGTGADHLTGGAGSNLFVYEDVADSRSSGAGLDVIEDFLGASGTSHLNRIDLSGIDAVPGGRGDAFVFVGTGEFSGVGQVRLVDGAGGVMVEANTSGGAEAEMQIWLAGVSAASLTAADFIL